MASEQAASDPRASQTSWIEELGKPATAALESCMLRTRSPHRQTACPRSASPAGLIFVATIQAAGNAPIALGKDAVAGP